MTKAMLKARLLSHVKHCVSETNRIKARRGMEERLAPWIVAKSSSFPELLTEPIIFANMIPVSDTS